MSVAIAVEHLSKAYRLGLISGETLKEDVERWWAKLRGRPDPLTKVGQQHARRIGEQFWALDDVSFNVGQGEVLGVIGRNGAGKSTLLKILSQVTAPTTGEVRIRGRVASLLEVGTGFHQELTGRENIFLNGAILGMTQAEVRKRLDEIIEFSGIEEFIDTPVKRYSSGMYVRLAFAVAAHLEPEILIVDEVLAVGDAAFQRKCMGKMGSAARDGRTILLVSHNMGAIETLTHRALVLEQGRVAFAGPTTEAIQAYVRSTGQLGGTDIDALPRTGSGCLRLRHVYVADERGRPTTIVDSSKPVTITLEYVGQSKTGTFRDVSFGVSLHDSNGQTLMIHYTDYQGDPFDRLPDSGAVSFRIPELPFKSGRYHIGARVIVNGIEADWPRGFVAHFDVELGDFFGTGRVFHSGVATYLMRGEWLVHESRHSGSKG